MSDTILDENEVAGIGLEFEQLSLSERALLFHRSLWHAGTARRFTRLATDLSSLIIGGDEDRGGAGGSDDAR